MGNNYHSIRRNEQLPSDTVAPTAKNRIHSQLTDSKFVRSTHFGMIQHGRILTSCLPFGFRSDTKLRSFKIYWKPTLRTWHCTITITGRSVCLWSSARCCGKLQIILNDLQCTQTQSHFRKVCGAWWNCIIRPIMMLCLHACVTVLRTIFVVGCVILVCVGIGFLINIWS